MPAKSWRRACRKAPWLLRLYGRMPRPSTARRGVESWIASLRESRVRETASPESESSKTTRVTSGLTRGASFGTWDRSSSFWRTCQGSLFPTGKEDEARLSAGYSESWPKTGGMQNGACYRRPSVVPRTSESGSSFWPTANVPNGGRVMKAEDVQAKGTTAKGKRQVPLEEVAKLWPTPDANVFQDGHDCTPEEWDARRQRLKENAKTPNGNGCGIPLAMAAQLWRSPGACSPNSLRGVGRDPNTRLAAGKQVNLQDQASFWATPRATDGEKGGPNQSFSAGSTPLATMSCQFSPPDQMTRSGEPSSNDSLSLLPRYRRWLYSRVGVPWKEMPTDEEELRANPVQLNPWFVDWLQGWPIGWTDFAPVATEWSRFKQLLHSLSSGVV